MASPWLYIPHPVLLLSVLEGQALRGRTMKMFTAAEKETHSPQTQPPETASCVLLWGHLSVVLPGLREILRLCLLFKDIDTTAPPGGSTENKLSSYGDTAGKSDMLWRFI